MTHSHSTGNLSPEERAFLLALARQSITAAAENRALPEADLAGVSEALRAPGACFVTLRMRSSGDLRGCTGVLVAQMPLVHEVIKTAAQTALHDPRFAPVAPAEVPRLEVEISVLTPPRQLSFARPEELVQLLRPGIDGVTLYRGPYRATFLPQVWDKIPDPVEFLDMLSQKMGLARGAWRLPGTEVEVYQVEEFADTEAAPA
jgi:hypothetical protein